MMYTQDIKEDNLWLMKGDCLERMKEIPNGSVDMVLADPPYGTTACKWDSVIPLEPMWVELKRIIKPSGAIVLFGAEPFSSVLRCSNLKMYKYDWYWDKVKPSGHLNARHRPMNLVETISVFCNGKTSYFPIMEKQPMRISKNYISNKKDQYGDEKCVVKHIDEKHPKQIISISNANQSGKVHPTQKPVALMEYLIKTYTNEKETVLDFTMGSGTTGAACVNTKRNFIGIERDDKYFDISVKRIRGEL